jgi:hypothetical protein
MPKLPVAAVGEKASPRTAKAHHRYGLHFSAAAICPAVAILKFFCVMKSLTPEALLLNHFAVD